MKDLDKILANPHMWTRDTLREAIAYLQDDDRADTLRQELHSRGEVRFESPSGIDWPDKDTLEAWYEDHTLAEIADKVGCSDTTVSKKLQKLDIHTPRPNIDWPDDDTLEAWHQDHNLTEIADKIGCSHQAVSDHFQRRDLERLSYSVDWPDPETLQEWNEDIGATAIARRLDCSRKAVYWKMNQYGIYN